MYRIPLLLCILLPLLGLGQIWETFSDEDFISNPSWSGDISKYQISSSTAIPASMRPSLQSFSTVDDTTYLSIENTVVPSDSMEWSFWWKISFNPSSGNYARFYLVSDQSNLTGALNGYYLSFGYAGNDRLTLVRQDGLNLTPILIGSNANLNVSSNQVPVRVRVVHTTSGEWRLYSDDTGGTAFINEGNCNDNTYTANNFIGLFNQYTSSNGENFYFDDLYFGPVVIDTIKPTVSVIKASSIFTLDVQFSESVTDETALDLSSYSVDHGIGLPLSVSKDAENPLKYILTFSQPFPDGVLCQLSLNQITDQSGNIIQNTSIPFAFYIPKAFEISINEIMADPTPAIGLPPYEYIELFNRTALPVNMEGWILKIGSTSKMIGNTTIPPGGYLILGSESAAIDFENFGPFFGFSSFSLSNTGALIQLISPSGKIISWVDYSDEWYKDNNKDEGGYSIEQVDPANPCGGISNYKATLSLLGGTPGEVNSVHSSNPDISKPSIYRAILQDSVTLLIWFNEAMDSTEVLNPYSYSIDHGITIGNLIKGNSPNYDKVILKLSPAAQIGVIYSVSFNDTVFDCAGNAISLSENVRFAISETPGPGDIVINEILSDPYEGGTDFIEIYNRSSKILDLRFAQLATLNDSLLPDGQAMIAPEGFPIFPDEYWVITEDKSAVLAYYTALNPQNFIEIENIPALNNDSGKVLIMLTDNTVIDRVDYSSLMHHPLLSSTDGVALERINPEASSLDFSNWHSAASSVGFATPTFQNSQFSDHTSSAGILLDPQVFSPDNDGFEDVLALSYQFEESGYIGNIRIFTLDGKPIFDIISNELLGTSGTFYWDGRDASNQLVSTGYYVIYTEVFSSKGEQLKFKNVVAVAARMK